MRWALMLATLLATGCGSLDHKDYVDQRAAAECKQLSVCARGYYESEFRDMDDCVNDWGDDLDDLEDVAFDDCDFDGKEASACVSRIRGLSCEDYAEGDSQGACDLVWDCR